MGRPVKEGLDYFELDCQLDDKIKLIQAEYGLKGFAIVVKLFQRIYGGHGYYCEWNDDSILLFMSENGLGSENKPLIKSITEACIRRKLFSEELYTKHQILTSSGIQKRYLNAVSRRESVKLEKAYLLVKVAHDQINVNINPINVDRNSVNADRNTQSREEKSREENNNKKRASLAWDVIDQMISGYGFSSGLSDAIRDWVRYKAERNQKYRETGFKNLLSGISAKAESIGEAAVIGAIRGSMSNNYQGIIWEIAEKKPDWKKNQNRFNNFHQREYDFQEMEKELLNTENREP